MDFGDFLLNRLELCAIGTPAARRTTHCGGASCSRFRDGIAIGSGRKV